MFFEVLVEGGADRPAVKEILQRRFGLDEGRQFRIHPHKGKGRLPDNPLASPDPMHRGLLDQLPAKLRGMSWMDDSCCLVVLVDADDEDCIALKERLLLLYQSLDRKPPRVLFRIAVEEIESWFIADHDAVENAYPSANLTRLRQIAPDAVVGAWERLAEALNMDPKQCRGPDKYEWASRISPWLDLDSPCSPSLRAFIGGIENCLETQDG